MTLLLLTCGVCAAQSSREAGLAWWWSVNVSASKPTIAQTDRVFVLRDGAPDGFDWFAANARPTAATLDAHIAEGRAILAAWRNIPESMPTGIEVPYIITVAATSGVAWAEGRLDDGTPYQWVAHASPWNAAAAESNRLAEYTVAHGKSLEKIAAEMGVSLADARWYATNRTAYASLTTANKAKRDRVLDALSKWQLIQAWRDIR